MANALIGAITNGEYTKTQASQDTTKANETATTSKSKETRDTGYNKDMFLQLLVAEMQYQDPLQPSDNSQYVAQLASFTQVEAMQAVQDNMEKMQSNSLVGKVVALNIDGEEISGKVDYVQKDDKNGMMLSIEGKLYEMSKMISVIDDEFYNAQVLAGLLTDEIKKLPDPEYVNIKDEEAVTKVAQIYSSMTDYELGFVEEDVIKRYKEIITAYAKLINHVESTDNKDVEPEKEKEPEAEAEDVQTV